MVKATDYMQGLELSELRRALHYDENTGAFTWLINLGRARRGSVAGKRHPHGYLWIGLRGFRYLAHRLAWFYVHGVWPKEEIDHEDMIKDHNWISNLREASKSQNMANMRAFRSSSHGFKGAKFDRRDGKYDAAIYALGKSHHLGRFDTAEEANRAYAEAAIRLRGEFARAA